MVKQTAGRTILGNFAPKFAALNDDVLFGEVWRLSRKLRSIITVSALIGKGMTDASLAYHLKEAKKNGVTQEEMAELLTHIAFYAGWPNAWAAFHLAMEVYENIHHAKSGGGQVLICVDGEGWYQEEGKEAQSLKAGDIVEIPANVKHWHGAKRESWFSHLAFEIPGTDLSNEWCEEVSAAAYDALTR